jgi:hypothetical protein
LSIFSLKTAISVAVTALMALTTAVVAAPQALADETNGTFDMSSFAQQPESLALTSGGAPGQQVQPTPAQNYVPSPSLRTGNQRLNLAVATRTILSQQGRSSLPVTNLDSFVYQSGMSDSIYGDEGSSGLPPFYGMDESHTIGSGISSSGLTTGHASNMPSAWCDYN